MKTNELKGAWLDYWVAHSQGVVKACLEIRQVPRTDDFMCVRLPLATHQHAMTVNYSTNWGLCGSILDKYRVTIDHDGFIGPVMCSVFDNDKAQWLSIEGKDAREAVCRAIVLLRFGNEVADIGAKHD